MHAYVLLYILIFKSQQTSSHDSGTVGLFLELCSTGGIEILCDSYIASYSIYRFVECSMKTIRI